MLLMVMCGGGTQRDARLGRNATRTYVCLCIIYGFDTRALSTMSRVPIRNALSTRVGGNAAGRQRFADQMRKTEV